MHHFFSDHATTILTNTGLLEENKLSERFLQTINDHLAAKGLMMREGTVVDATIIAAPASTKNRDKMRDPQMHSTKKGNEWHFGMKAHIGVDAQSGLVHTLVTTAANTSDVVVGQELLHGDEKVVYADAGYVGIEKRQAVEQATTDTDEVSAPVWRIAMRRGKLKSLSDDLYGRVCRRLEYLKSHTRSKVEHVFHVIKNRFGLRKVRYKGLAKNTAQLYSLLGLANLVLAGRQFAAPSADGGMYTQGAS
jgi:IS5 family transposase